MRPAPYSHEGLHGKAHTTGIHERPRRADLKAEPIAKVQSGTFDDPAFVDEVEALRQPVIRHLGLELLERPAARGGENPERQAIPSPEPETGGVRRKGVRECAWVVVDGPQGIGNNLRDSLHRAARAPGGPRSGLHAAGPVQLPAGAARPGHADLPAGRRAAGPARHRPYISSGTGSGSRPGRGGGRRHWAAGRADRRCWRRAR